MTKVLRNLIQEMLQRRYEKSLQEGDNSKENSNVVPNTTETKFITVIGDPIDDVELNAMVKNIPMPQTGAKLVPTTNKPSSPPTKGKPKVQSEQNKQKTNTSKDVTDQGDPIEDVQHNPFVKNIPMGKGGAKLVPTTKKSAKVLPQPRKG